MTQQELNQKGLDIMAISLRLRQANNKGQQEKVNEWIDKLVAVVNSFITDHDDTGRIIRS